MLLNNWTNLRIIAAGQGAITGETMAMYLVILLMLQELQTPARVHSSTLRALLFTSLASTCLAHLLVVYILHRAPDPDHLIHQRVVA